MAVGETAPPHTEEDAPADHDKAANGVIYSDVEEEAKLNKANHQNEHSEGKAKEENASFLSDDDIPAVDEDTDPDYRCGWFGLTCSCLKPFRSAKWALALLCLSSVMQGFIVNGLLNVVISTIEKVGH